MGNVHFSSDRMDWATPDDFFTRLNQIYSFDLDVAASEGNARCAQFFDQNSDGLAQSWAGHRVWCNPPYGREIGQWVQKATQEAKEARFIVMLVPSRTDTKWWHEALKSARVEFIKGRLKFKGAKASAPFPSALLFWNC